MFVAGEDMNLPKGVLQLLARQAAVYSDGDAGDLVTDLRHPVAVFLPDGLRVERTPAESVAIMRRLQAQARAQGVVRFRHTILSARVPRADRPAVTVVWRFLDAADAEVARSRVCYFLAAQPDGTFLIEMIEYQSVAFALDLGVWPRPAPPPPLLP